MQLRFLIIVIALGTHIACAGSTLSTNAVKLQGLDKVTGRVFSIQVKVGVPVKFGTLEIIPRSCQKKPPEDPPESAVFLEIWETPVGEKPQKVFSSWMFASSPGISSLDHPVYDVWVSECVDIEKNMPQDLSKNASSLFLNSSAEQRFPEDTEEFVD
jgi:hypothetical protein